jgi:hypothetical protein
MIDAIDAIDAIDIIGVNRNWDAIIHIFIHGR